MRIVGHHSIQFHRSQYNMKSIVAVVLAIGSVSALGSGPYLPSGWRPQGPAFLLPGEVQKPADNPSDNPFKDTLFFGAEASNSDALREYGPPKAANVISQALPDVVTETSFLVLEKTAEEAVVSQENTEQISDVAFEATTEALIVEVQPTIVYERLADIELQTDAITTYADDVKEVQTTVASIEEKVEEFVEAKEEQVVEEKLEKIVEEQKVEEKLAEVVVQEVEGVKNIAEALVNLETEIKAEQVQNEAVAEIKVQESSGSAQVPEGFLEYGPPGFREYGPPKGDELLRTAAIIQEPSNSVSESNDARRRRFSPKFRSTKAKRIH